jgi:thiol-disulfide isomerase/thioredoxin
MLNLSSFVARAALCAVFAFVLLQTVAAQKPAASKATSAGPKVTQVDINGLKALLKPNGKPLMINFWATWCDPCREEFPDLVKLDAAYKGKIDFLTVSLDDVADMNALVPKFLAEQKAEMPAYLLTTPDENAAIALVSKEWNGNLPLTIIYAPGGGVAYLRKGKIKGEVVSAEIDKLLAPGAKAVTPQ